MDSWVIKVIEKALEDAALSRVRAMMYDPEHFRFRGYSAEQLTLLILSFESKYTIADSSLSIIEMQKLLNK